MHLRLNEGLGVAPAAPGRAGPRRLLVIYNPTSGRRRRGRLRSLLGLLRARGCQIELHATGGPGDAERLAAGASAQRHDVVVAAGGDGTINEVVNGLRDPHVALAILPLGTANVLAATIGLGRDLESIARTIATGSARPICLGEVNGRRFLLMVGAGLDAQVILHLSRRLKRWLGRGAYVIGLLRELGRSRFPRYRLRVDGAIWDCASVVIANGGFYGGRYVCAPMADLARPELQVCLFQKGGRMAALLYGLALVAGWLPRLKSYRILTAREVELLAPAGVALHADGDIAGQLPATIRVLPDALRLLYPA